MVTAASPADRARGHHRLCTYGPVWAAHPKGEAHDSALPPASAMSPSARSTNAAPSSAPAMPEAARENSLIWAVIAAMPAKTIPLAPVATPTRTEPAVGYPALRVSAVTTAAAARFASAATTRVA